MPKSTRDKWADKGVNTTVEQIVEAVNDSKSFSLPFIFYGARSRRSQDPVILQLVAARQNGNTGTFSNIYSIVLHSDRTGSTCEVSRGNRWYRDQPPFKDDVQRQVIEEVCSFKNIGLEFEAARAAGELPTS